MKGRRLGCKFYSMHRGKSAVAAQGIFGAQVMRRRARDRPLVAALDGVDETHCATVREQRPERFTFDQHGS
jgi:hypothetical protein